MYIHTYTHTHTKSNTDCNTYVAIFSFLGCLMAIEVFVYCYTCLYLCYKHFSYVLSDKNYLAKQKSSTVHGYPSPKQKGGEYARSAGKKRALGKTRLATSR